MRNTLLNLPLHPTMRHPLTGQPLQAIGHRADGRAIWPIMGGAEDGGDGTGAGDGGGSGGDDGAKGGASGSDNGTGGTGADDKGDKGGDNGFPANTPVAQMKPEEQAAYHRFHSRKHEERATAYHTAVGGLSADEVKAKLDRLATLEREQMSEKDRAVEDAKREASQTTAREYGLKAARTAFEFALGHDPESNNQSDLIDTLDMSKVLTDSGEVDTAKVRAIVGRIAPADKDKGGRQYDFGGGNRGGTKVKTGVTAGAELFDVMRKKTTTSTS